MISKLTNLTTISKSHYSANETSKFLYNTHDILIKHFCKYSKFTFVSKFKSMEKE